MSPYQFQKQANKAKKEELRKTEAKGTGEERMGPEEFRTLAGKK